MTNSPRIFLLDNLRGISILGILLAHIVSQFAGVLPEDHREILIGNQMDFFLNGFVSLMLGGKFFMLFAFLFGVTFEIQKNGQKIGGFSKYFSVRMLILAVFGLLHYLFFQGDILLPYALLGLLLLPIQNWSDRKILITGLLLFSGLPKLILFIFNQFVFDLEIANIEIFFHSNYQAVRFDSWAKVAALNLSNWMGMIKTFQLGYFGRAFQIYACFLFGIYFYRKDLFRLEIIRQTSFLKRMEQVLVLSILGVASCYAFSSYFDLNTFGTVLGLVFYDGFNLSVSGLILYTGIKYASTNEKFKYFGLVGRMSLTQYILQSLFFTFFFFNWGLGFFGKLSVSWSVLIGLIFFGFQIGFSYIWLNQFKRGPLETVWSILSRQAKI